ncbi:MAG: DM13 domain-containing protein [Nitrospinae bacterium]|nr:DM13 domain-containing protein [Nitrospinota bacterium]
MKSGELTGTDAEHPASGTVKMVGNTVLLEDVNITEAPDGRVILTINLEQESGVSLGKLQGFTGSHGYTIPEGTSTSDFNSVLIWCDQFKVPIGKVEF